MNRILAILLTLIAATAAAQFQPATSIKTTEVVPGIYMVEGVDGFAGGNMSLLVGDDYVAMIDDGIDPVAPILLAHVTETAGRPINFMINTHIHGDHVGGNAHFAENGTVIFAHDNIRKRLLEDTKAAGGDGGLPVVTFGEGVTFHLNGVDAKVFHVPQAHTDGDAAIHFPDVNVIHAGDLMFHKLFPYIDLDSGGSVRGYIAAQQKLLSMADDQTKIIPGHGGLATKADLQKDLMALTDSQARVKLLVDQDKTLEEILQVNPLSVYHDTYNWSFITTEKMTQTLYRELTEGE